MSARARWSLRNIYLYLVCLITLIMVIVAVVGLVRNVVELMYPDPYAYVEPAPQDQQDADFDAEYYAAERERSEASQRRYTVLSLVGNAAMLLVAGPLYVYHWRKIETEPETTPGDPGVSGE